MDYLPLADWSQNTRGTGFLYLFRNARAGALRLERQETTSGLSPACRPAASWRAVTLAWLGGAAVGGHCHDHEYGWSCGLIFMTLRLRLRLRVRPGAGQPALGCAGAVVCVCGPVRGGRR